MTDAANGKKQAAEKKRDKQTITVRGATHQYLARLAERYNVVPFHNLTQIIFRIGLIAVDKHGLDEAIHFATKGNPKEIKEHHQE